MCVRSLEEQRVNVVSDMESEMAMLVCNDAHRVFGMPLSLVQGGKV